MYVPSRPTAELNRSLFVNTVARIYSEMATNTWSNRGKTQDLRESTREKRNPRSYNATSRKH